VFKNITFLDLQIAYIYIVWRVSPMRELLKHGASKQARNRRRTSVYSSLLSNARNSRESSHASPSSLVATQQRGKNISAAVSRHATIAAPFSERSALTNSTRRAPFSACQYIYISLRLSVCWLKITVVLHVIECSLLHTYKCVGRI
jgi:hypothetical protein